MEKHDGIECTTKGKGALAAPFILSVIGVPHLAVGLISSFLFRSEPVGVIVGLAFCCSGLICLGIATVFLLRWRNQKATATAEGLHHTDLLGRESFHPWSEVSASEESSSAAIVLDCPSGKVRVYKSQEAYAELKGLLFDLGLLAPDAEEPSETVRIVSEQKLF